MGNRGQPKIDYFVKFIIAYKVIQYQKRYNLTPRASWLKLTTHKTFKDLMKEHFKGRANYLLENILDVARADGLSGNIKDAKLNFYKNHIRKIIAEFPKLKIYTPAEYKSYLAKIKANKSKGIGSLKNTIKRVRKP
tara:strand:- start:458 stop:865 length:408 start_codon:yes stop_codon:yes gene_type:complete